MQRILDLRSCLLGAAALLLFATGCGQGEGDRCQVNSDCASGLTCNGSSGNGTCGSISTPTPTSTNTNTNTSTSTATMDGSAGWDGGEDTSGGTSVDAGLDVTMGTTMDSDGTSVDTSPVDAAAE